MKLLIVIMMFISFFVGFLSSMYKTFPYSQMKYIKDIVIAPKPIAATDYIHKKSFFELLGGESNVVMVGDSITSNADWSEVFEGVSISNRGISGDTTDGV